MTFTSLTSTPISLGHDLREGGLFALSVRRCADEDVHFAARVKADNRALPESALEPDRAGDLRRPEAADFDVVADADSEVAALLAELRLFLAQPLVVDVLERLVERQLVVAAVVAQAGDHRVAVFERRQKIPVADLGRIDVHRVRQLVEHPFEHEARLRTAGAAVRFDRRRVRVDAVDVLAHRGHVVRAGQHQAVQDRRDAGRRRREKRAHARPHGAAQSEDVAVAGRGHLDFLHMIAAMRRRLIVLAAGFGPLDRAAQLHRAERGDEFAGVRGDLAAEPAAHFRSDHAQLVLGHAGDERSEEAEDVRVLRRVPERQLAGRGDPVGQRRSRFHRGRNQPLLDDAILDDDIGFGERGVHVTAGHDPVKRLVVRNVGVNLRRARRRWLSADR